MNSNEVLIENLHQALFNKDTYDQVYQDFTKTFQSLGFEDEKAALAMAYLVLEFIEIAKSIQQAEKWIKSMFQTKTYKGRNVFQMIVEGLQQRFEIIFNQINPHLPAVGTSTIDYGCGSGTLGLMLHDRCSLTIEGVDVRNFRAEPVPIPIHIFDGYNVPVSDKHYMCAVLTNVIHHDPDNEKILQELDRIVSRKLIIIETVPEADDEESAKKDWSRMLLNDTLWNRFFNYADIPVPGTYDIPSNWIKRFEKYGWKCTHSEDLGFDQPTIQDRHHLFVFER